MLYDLIIIGADAAGLTAGIYAGRKKINALILTKKIGGQSLFAGNIENYPGFLGIPGAELTPKIKQQVEKFGVPVEEEQEVVSVSKNDKIFAVKTSKKEYNAKSVIIATGGHWRPLNILGEKEFMGRGVSVCAICDAPFYTNKIVAVVGAGNSAFRSAFDLLKYAAKIYILSYKEVFTGDKIMYEALEKSNKIEFVTNANTKEIRGSKFVEELIYEEVKTGETKKLKIGGVFINIGQIPNSSFVENFLELNKKREIVIDTKTNAASISGIFGAGDVTDIKYKQFVIAAAEGAKAALSVCDYLSNSSNNFSISS